MNKNKLRTIIPVFMLFCLSGCDIRQRIAERQAANDDAVCQSYGAQLGSSQYIQCRQRIDDRRAQAFAACQQNVAQIESAPADPPGTNMYQAFSDSEARQSNANTAQAGCY